MNFSPGASFSNDFVRKGGHMIVIKKRGRHYMSANRVVPRYLSSLLIESVGTFCIYEQSTESW